MRVSFILFFSCLLLVANDWPQLLGPNRNGYIEDSDFKGKINISELWSMPVGEGFGGAAISKGLAYILDREDDDSDIIKCIELKSGKVKWRYEYKSEARFGFNGSRSIPSVDDKNVYTVGVLGHISCLDKISGKLKWQRNLNSDWGAEAPPWGFGSSVLIHNNMCIAAPLSNTAGIVALNTESGKTIWKSKPFGTAPGYSSPIHYEMLGKDMIIQMSGDAMAGFEPKAGKELWRWEGYSVKRAIPAPLKISKDKLFITGGYESGSLMLKLEEKGGDIKPTVDFLLEKKGAQIHVPILKDNYLYANFNENDNLKKRAVKQGLTCIDLKGKILWNTGDKPNLNRGNIIMVNNWILALDGVSGELIVSEANPKAYKEIYRKKLLEGKGGNIWAPIAYSKGTIIIRDQNEMKCLKIYN